MHRTDDGNEVVRERLKVYHRETKPIVEFYSGRPTFQQIDGNQPPDVVTTSMDRLGRSPYYIDLSTGGQPWPIWASIWGAMETVPPLSASSRHSSSVR